MALIGYVIRVFLANKTSPVERLIGCNVKVHSLSAVIFLRHQSFLAESYGFFQTPQAPIH